MPNDNNHPHHQATDTSNAPPLQKNETPAITGGGIGTKEDFTTFTPAEPVNRESAPTIWDSVAAKEARTAGPRVPLATFVDEFVEDSTDLARDELAGLIAAKGVDQRTAARVADSLWTAGYRRGVDVAHAKDHRDGSLELIEAVVAGAVASGFSGEPSLAHMLRGFAVVLYLAKFPCAGGSTRELSIKLHAAAGDIRCSHEVIARDARRVEERLPELRRMRPLAMKSDALGLWRKNSAKTNSAKTPDRHAGRDSTAQHLATGRGGRPRKCSVEDVPRALGEFRHKYHSAVGAIMTHSGVAERTAKRILSEAVEQGLVLHAGRWYSFKNTVPLAQAAA